MHDIASAPVYILQYFLQNGNILQYCFCCIVTPLVIRREDPRTGFNIQFHLFIDPSGVMADLLFKKIVEMYTVNGEPK
jgi:hypothetical protein